MMPSTWFDDRHCRCTSISSAMSVTRRSCRLTLLSESRDSMPAMRSVKNASDPSERAGRASAKPTVLARAPTRARAAELGCQWFSSTIARMR